MAFTEAERVQIRRFLGYPAVHQGEGRSLNSSIAAVQAAGDGGLMADNSTEVAVRGFLANLAALEAQIAQLWESMLASKIETIEIDPARGLFALYADARRLVGHISDALDVRPVRDVFSPPAYAGR